MPRGASSPLMRGAGIFLSPAQKAGDVAETLPAFRAACQRFLLGFADQFGLADHDFGLFDTGDIDQTALIDRGPFASGFCGLHRT